MLVNVGEYMKKNIEELDINIHVNIQKLKEGIGQSSDVLFHQFYLGQGKYFAVLIMIEGLTETKFLAENVIRSLQKSENMREDHLIQDLSTRVLEVNNALAATYSEIENALLIGKSVLLVEGRSVALTLETKKAIQRNVEEPASETLVRGPRIGFIEELRSNTAIIRQRANDPNLIIKELTLGERNKKKVAVVFIKGLTDEELINDVLSRLGSIKIDDLQESGYIEQLIEDNPYSIFPQVQSTERPDRVIAALLEGRISILLDGTPYALIVPVTLNLIFQTPEDYYQRWIPSSLLRILRYIAAAMTIFLPGLYISLASFHPGLLPTKMAVAMAAGRQNIPFPPIIEALIMEVTIELLREAGLRLPRPIGQTIGLVGGVIIGQAAVQANIVSAVMVIIVSVTAIASFTIPHYDFGLPLRIIRFGSMFCAACLGLFGLMMFFLLILGHMFQLKSFGYNFFTPSFSQPLKDLKDVIIRAPLRAMKTRPTFFQAKDQKRQR